MCSMWLPTVFGLIPSCRAMPLLGSPCASKASTSLSRVVSPDGPPAAAALRVPGGREDRVGRSRIEPFLRPLRCELAGGVVLGHGAAVRTALGHCLVGVGGHEPRAGDDSMVRAYPRW